ncbi:TIGR02281 family clan AA aspartic protease [Amaricoccus sp. HAR-UPW-R2A-40]|nr:TIGR02281 family clan AA aspartic protease [Amaricoccus sp. HAR-UPW-R2A-40]
MAIIAYSYRDTIRGALFPATAVRMEGGGVELRRGADGHFQATLEVNGVPIRFIVDTGATEIVLARADAAKAGIDLDALVFSGRAMTANGPVPTARIRLDSVTLGDVTAQNLPASVTAGALQTSLLGMTYLNRFERIEISGDRMRLTH